jgi:nitrite reductase (NADH) large subunit
MKHVIVGNGVAGVTAAQSIVRADPSAEVHILGAEPYPYYRRPLLWEFIAGQIEQEALYFRPPDWYAERSIQLHLGARVAGLDLAAQRIALGDDSHTTYDRLLLATGGRPFVPRCEGTGKAGVFTLRTLDDALAIKSCAQRASTSTAAVIGGGLLGLETARALHAAGLKVTVVEFFRYLLPRQLDVEGAEVLQSLLEAQGLQVVTDATTAAILGDGRADGIRLKDNRVVDSDLVLFCTGIRSEVTLAQEAGLAVNRGIVVDRQMQTRQADGQPVEGVFAVGDAAEFEGRVYGIIPPAIEQARVAAANMVAPGSTTYSGTLPTTTLKVAGAELTSLGDSVVEGEEHTQLRHADRAAGQYRKVVLRDGCIVGAILLNDPDRARPITQLIERGVDVSAHAEQLLNDDFDLKSLLREA